MYVRLEHTTRKFCKLMCCDNHVLFLQLLTESQVHTGAAGSPSLLNSAPPAQAPSPAERSNREQRRPGSLDKKAIYRSHM